MFSSFSPSAEAHRLVFHHRLNLTVSPVKHTASSRRFADCSAGVQDPSGKVCCSAACGLCGGRGCSGRPGGPQQCCMPAVLRTGRVCESRADVACILRGSSNYTRGDGVEHASQTRSSSAEVAIGIAMKLCAAGIEHATLQVCCNASCGQCGRHGCASAPGGPRQCCMPAILRDGKRCLSSRDVGCVMRRIDTPTKSQLAKAVMLRSSTRALPDTESDARRVRESTEQAVCALSRQQSRVQCSADGPDRNFGCVGRAGNFSVWTARGCRGIFRCGNSERAVRCGSSADSVAQCPCPSYDGQPMACVNDWKVGSARQVRRVTVDEVAVILLTVLSNVSARRQRAVRQTWGRALNGELYVASEQEMRASLAGLSRYILSPKRPAHTRDYYIAARSQFMVLQRAHMDGAFAAKRWVVLADDDVFINVAHLLRYLERYDADTPLLIGHCLGQFPCFWGFTMVLSRAAFRPLSADLAEGRLKLPNRNDCELLAWAQQRNITTVHSNLFWGDREPESRKVLDQVRKTFDLDFVNKVLAPSVTGMLAVHGACSGKLQSVIEAGVDAGWNVSRPAAEDCSPMYEMQRIVSQYQ